MRHLIFLCAALSAQATVADDITFIDQCGVSSSAHGETMVVTGDILLEEVYGTCVSISHENVTLDCQGYVLTAPLGGLPRAVNIDDEAHFVTVRNCKLSGYWFFGINTWANSGLIEHKELEIAGVGVMSSGSENEIRFNKIVEGGWVAISLGDAHYNWIHHNNIFDKQAGIILNQSRLNEVSYNVLIGNGGTGIGLFSDSNQNTIMKNKSHRNMYGFSLSDSYENLVIDNIANNNDIGFRDTGDELDNIYEGNICNANSIQDSNVDGLCK